MRIRIITLLSILAVLFTCLSCGEKTKEDPMDNLLISIRTPMELHPQSVVKSTFFSGRGPIATDKVRLKSAGGGKDYTFPITELGSDYFTFTIGDTFESGTYDFCIVRGEREKSFGKVVYTFIVNSELEPTPGSTVYGVVSCGDKGVGGVQVSDGYNIVVTDKDGVYQLASKKANGYVFITIPSGYEVASTGILPQFYQYTRQAPASPSQNLPGWLQMLFHFF